MKRCSPYRVCLFGVGVLCLAGPALGQQETPWEDCIEDYNVGEPLCGKGGWRCLEPGIPIVSDACAHSGRKSVQIGGKAEAAMMFKTVTDGHWVLTASVYVPSGQGIAGAHYIVQNQYNEGGPYAWSIQIRFHPDCNPPVMISDFDGNTHLLPVDEWFELKHEIDLTDEVGRDGWQKVYVNGEFCYEKVWNCGVGACGDRHFAALLLYVGGKPAVYYDDLALQPAEDVQLTCCDTYGCQKDCGGVACTGRERMKLRCRRSKLRATVKRAQPGEWFIFRLDTGEQEQTVVKSNGKSKARFKNVQPGARTVTTDCDLRGQVNC